MGGEADFDCCFDLGVSVQITDSENLDISLKYYWSGFGI